MGWAGRKEKFTGAEHRKSRCSWTREGRKIEIGGKRERGRRWECKKKSFILVTYLFMTPLKSKYWHRLRTYIRLEKCWPLFNIQTRIKTKVLNIGRHYKVQSQVLKLWSTEGGKRSVRTTRSFSFIRRLEPAEWRCNFTHVWQEAVWQTRNKRSSGVVNLISEAPTCGDDNDECSAMCPLAWHGYSLSCYL